MRRLALFACLLAVLAPHEALRADDWRDTLRQELERLDGATPGTLGVYVKRLGDGSTLSYGADQRWYLASTAKVPIAVAVLQQVDAGKLQLSTVLTLEEGDKVDGSGPLVWNRAGTDYSIDTLLTRMLGDSDNTAANMLVRAVDPKWLNSSAEQAFGGSGQIGELTTFTQVRYDVYAELDPQARELTHRQLVEIAGVPMARRADAVRRALKAEPGGGRGIDEAYERYYATGRNSATLPGYGAMLERLVRGQLVSPASTERLFKAMKFETRGNYRLEAGLPARVRFIHKTGTQHQRACHMGVVDPQQGGRDAVVVAVCAAGLDEQRVAGRLFEQVGRAIGRTLPAPAPN